MIGSTSSLGFVLLVAAGIAIYFLVTMSRHRSDYREYLEPILKQHGLKLVFVACPGLFHVGPFPKLEVKSGRPQSQMFGMRGEHSQYRIVTIEDLDGKTHQIWAKLEFECFNLHQVRWRAERIQELPPAVVALLEDNKSQDWFSALK